MNDVRKASALEDDKDPYVSVRRAGKEIGRADATVLNLVVAGELAAERVAGRTVISKTSIRQYKARHGIGEMPEAVAR